MSDLSEVIDRLDYDGVLHSADSTAVFASGGIGVASPVASSSWVPFTVFFKSLLIGLLFLIFANTFASFFGRVVFGDS